MIEGSIKDDDDAEDSWSKLLQSIFDKEVPNDSLAFLFNMSQPQPLPPQFAPLSPLRASTPPPPTLALPRIVMPDQTMIACQALTIKATYSQSDRKYVYQILNYLPHDMSIAVDVIGHIRLLLSHVREEDALEREINTCVRHERSTHPSYARLSTVRKNIVNHESKLLRALIESNYPLRMNAAKARRPTTTDDFEMLVLKERAGEAPVQPSSPRASTKRKRVGAASFDFDSIPIFTLSPTSLQSFQIGRTTTIDEATDSDEEASLLKRERLRGPN